MKEELKLFYFSSNYAMDFLFVVVTLNTISTEIKKKIIRHSTASSQIPILIT